MERTPQEEALARQIKEQFHRAFYDTIAAAIASGDHQYIVRLYTEIRDRLAAQVKPNGNAFQRIHAEFDVPFFAQLLHTGNFSGQSMLGLVNTTFDWINRLQAPKRDAELTAAKQRVIDSGTTMANTVPAYIREVHTCLDWVEADMREFSENREHPVVQEMLRRAVRRHTK